MNSQEIFQSTVFPVMGCTEPAAVALAVALARASACNKIPDWVFDTEPTEKVFQGKCEPKSILDSTELLRVRTSRSIFKNAMAVGIPPAAGEAGIHIAAAMGLFLPAYEGLNLLKSATEEIAKQGKTILKNKTLLLEIDERDTEIYIEAMVICKTDGERHVGEAIIQGGHDRIHLLRRDGKIVFENKEDKPNAKKESIKALANLSLKELIEMAQNITDENRDYLLKGITMNRKAAKVGIEKSLGLKVGASIKALIDEGVLKEDLYTLIKMETAGAADARMSGYEVEIMSSSGSGNQGIMAILPIAVAGEMLGIEKKRIAEALALSHFLTAHMTKGIGLLSALCGCVVKAGIGAAAGIAYLIDGREEVISGSISNMAGNIVGEICDGAKVGCAFKMATAAVAAAESALLAKRGVRIPSSNGIVGDDSFKTIKNISEISNSMRDVDNAIVEIIKEQNS